MLTGTGTQGSVTGEDCGSTCAVKGGGLYVGGVADSTIETTSLQRNTGTLTLTVTHARFINNIVHNEFRVV